MSHGRKYGEKDSHPIPLWNGIFEHYYCIGAALWEFAWCIDRVTKERDGVGIVLGGVPVKITSIVADLKGSNRETVRRHMDSLERENYIRRRRTPYGHVIEVLNSRKFGIWKKEKPRNAVSPAPEKREFVSEKPKSMQEKHGFVVYKEDSAVTQQVHSSVRLPVAAFWQEMGIDPKRLSGEIRNLCEKLHATAGDQSPVEFLSVSMDAIQGMGWRIPPELAQAKAEIRANGNGHQHREPMRELDPEPWGAGSGIRQ